MKHSFYNTIGEIGTAKLLFPALCLMIVVFSCSKNQSSRPPYPGLLDGSALNAAKAYLRDSLSPAAYDSLDFSDIIVDSASTGNLFLRFPSIGDPVAHRFILVELTPGMMPLKSAGFRIEWNSIATTSTASSSPAQRPIPQFNGSITKTWLNGTVAYASPVVDGFITALHPEKTVAADAVGDKTTYSDFDGTGEELPEIIIQAPLTPEVNLMDFLDLAALAGDGSSGSYASGGGSGSASSVLSNPAITAYPAINLKGYLACFSLLANASSTYSVTLYAFIPTINPLITTNSSGVSGQSFIGLSMTTGGQPVNQYIGFNPACSSCASNGQLTPSMIVNMSGASYNASYTVGLSQSQFNDLVKYMEANSSAQYQKDLLNGNDFSYDNFTYNTGVNLGIPITTGPLLAGEITPNGIYLAIEQKAAAGVPGAYANPGVKTSVGTSHGNCGGSAE